MKHFLIVALALALTGCLDPEEQRAANQINNRNAVGSFQSPEFVATLNNGHPVSRVTLEYTDRGDNRREHVLYIVGGAQTVTLNKEVPYGKTTITETTAVINLTGSSPEEIIEQAKKIQATKEAEERALWQKLNNKYGTQ